MNRLNQMIDKYATIAAGSMISANLCARDGFTEEARSYMDDTIAARHNLEMWIKISQAVRGWQL